MYLDNVSSLQKSCLRRRTGSCLPTPRLSATGPQTPERKALGVARTGLAETRVRFAENHLQAGTEEMIHPIPIAKYVVRAAKKHWDRIFSFSPFPRSLVQVEGIPAPVERSLTHWLSDRDERSSSRQQPPEASRSRDLPFTGRKRVEQRQANRLPIRQPEHETRQRPARSRSR
jgi:hypothetical protein